MRNFFLKIHTSVRTCMEVFWVGDGGRWREMICLLMKCSECWVFCFETLHHLYIGVWKWNDLNECWVFVWKLFTFVHMHMEVFSLFMIYQINKNEMNMCIIFFETSHCLYVGVWKWNNLNECCCFFVLKLHMFVGTHMEVFPYEW